MVRVHKITCGATHNLVVQARVDDDDDGDDGDDDGDDDDDGDGCVIDRCVGGA